LLYSVQGAKVWEEAAADLRRYRTLDKKSRRMVPLESFQTLFREKAEATLLFMAEHLDELATLPVEKIEPFLNEILNSSAMTIDHHGLFIRLEKLLAERVSAGEETVRPLMDKTRKALKDLAKSEKKTSKPRKSRR
jgi:hypothetical protein